MSRPSDPTGPEMRLETAPDGTLTVRLGGRWQLREGVPPARPVEEAMAGPEVRRVIFETSGVESWDSGLLIFLRQVLASAGERRLDVDRDGLPAGVRRLLSLASAVPEATEARRSETGGTWLSRVGASVGGALGAAREALVFLGEVTLAAGRVLSGRATFRRVDFWATLQQVGAQALPIVSLLSFLVGLILAYVGAVQLRQFGAQIYVADLVGLAVAREMGPMMTGIIMAGRTGAAFAAQLGSMQVNEEIDALRTLAISATEFLVMPRMLALILMMPLLCLYADFLGILGGGVIGLAVMDLGTLEYFEQSKSALGVGDFVVGLIKGSVFGVMVAIAGCYHGIRCGRSSAAVGEATTAAVVTSIVLIILSDSALTVIYDILGV